MEEYMKCIKILIICSLLLVITNNLIAGEKFVIRFNNPTLEIVNEFTSEEFDIASFNPGIYMDLVVNELQYKEIKARGYDIEITQTESQLRENMISGRDLDGYRTYDDVLTELQQIEIDYPDICKLYDIGESQGKLYSDAGNSNYDDYYHEIWVLKVSDNVEVEEDEPCVYYMGAHHAREPISTEVSMAVLNHILDNYGVDPTITDNVDNTQIWFAPLVNPNGHKIVTDEDNLWWRKNIRDNDENGFITPSSGYDYPDGVDPNRNYSFEWGYVGASGNINSQTYHGPYAFSEPEIVAMKELMDSHHFVTGITYHSYSELVLFPFGYNIGVIAPDHDALEELAIAIATPMGYIPQAAWELYPCMGTTDDYSYGTHGTFSFTVELATEFIPPAAQVQSICNENIQPAMILLDRVNHSGLTGHITDFETGDAIQAEIFVEGVDDTGVFRYPYTSNEDCGTYYRLLTDGSYEVTFSADGYVSQTEINVDISNSGQTILDIALLPDTFTIDISGTVTDGDTGLPISNAIVDIQDFNIPAVITNENGEYTIEGLYEFNYSIAVYSLVHAGILEQHFITAANNVIDFGLYSMPDGTFESGEFASSWNFSGNNNWVIDDVTVFSGNYSAKSGTITDDQTSSLFISLFVQEDSEISFYQKVSSETNYDYLRFYIDNVLKDSWSGNGNWEFETFNVESGFHTFKWEYYKDGGVSSYQDCVWIDEITFPIPSVIITPAILEFYNIQACTEGLEFSIINNSSEEVTINTIDESGSVFDWYINEFNLPLPYTMSGGEQLDFLVMVALPVTDGGRDIVSEILNIDTSEGEYQIELFFDTNLYNSTNNNEVSDITKFLGNYPNPFNPSTTFSYSLANESKVKLIIFNVKGQKIRTLINKGQNAGMHQVIWNGMNDNGEKVSSGIYFSLFDIHGDGDYTSVKKVLLLK
jgi:hypothetical protein